MTGTGQAGSDFFRRWVEATAALLDAGPAPLWQQAERVHAEWCRFAEAFAGAGAARRADPAASPFDPAGFLRGEGQGGMADLLRWLEGPTLAGPMGEYARAVQGTRDWLAYLAAVEQMKAVMAEGWLAAFRRFLSDAAAEDRAAEAAGGARPGLDRLTEIWRAAAAAELAQTHRKPAFLAAQRDLVRAETDLRRALRMQVERVAEELGLPTRAELDDMHASLHALGREARRARARARADEP